MSFQEVQCSEDRNNIKQEGKSSIKLKRLASIYCCLCAGIVISQLYKEILWQSLFYIEVNVRHRVISQRDNY